MLRQNPTAPYLVLLLAVSDTVLCIGFRCETDPLYSPPTMHTVLTLALWLPRPDSHAVPPISSYTRK
jgi:hypothetical protein